jgi:hypothetical protein
MRTLCTPSKSFAFLRDGWASCAQESSRERPCHVRHVFLNMGHIHSHSFNEQAADGCRRCLSLNISTYSRILSKYDLAFFFMNFLKTDMLQCTPTAPLASLHRATNTVISIQPLLCQLVSYQVSVESIPLHLVFRVSIEKRLSAQVIRATFV